MDFNEGEIIYIDKPLHWTSFDVVKRIRLRILRRIKQKKLKVGHAGTLNPLATGVMIICTGRATKRIEEFQYQTKEYIATLRLGATTPSFDLETEIDGVYPHEHITRESVERTLPRHPAVLQDERLIKFVEEFLPEAELRAAVEQLFQQFILCGHSHPHFPVLSDFCNLLFPKKGRGSFGASSPWCTVALITQR